MLPGRIQGATRNLGKPEGWVDDLDGPCSHLPIVDVMTDSGINLMISHWEILPDELERLKQGAPMFLQVVGELHPPVMLWVGDVPEIEDWTPPSDSH